MTDHQTIIEHHAKIYHRFRHLGPEVARAAADEAIAEAHQTPERSVGGMVPPLVGNSGLEDGQ